MDFSAILANIDVDAILTALTDLLAKIDLQDLLQKLIELVTGLIK